VRLSYLFAIISLAGLCNAQQITRLQKSTLVSETILPNAPQSQILKAELISLHTLTKPTSTLATFVSAPSLEGTHAQLTLAGEVSSRLASGSSFLAKLDEPVSADGRVLLPAGTTIEGHIESKPARRLMRPGSLFMTFDRVILPSGEVQPANLHLISSESVAVKADSEGMLHPTINKKRLAIQLGGTALTAKFADDLAEVAGGTAVGAGTARFVGLGAAATFFALQKGREVKLHPGEKLEVEFGRAGAVLPPVSWKSGAAAPR
jgi:hypothetical protein